MADNTTIPTAENINGEGVITGADYVRDREAFIAETAARYAKTPVYQPEVIPQGYSCHIGDGVWLKRCSGCDTYVLTYGNILYINEFAAHEATHGGQVLGYNVGILSNM